MNSSSSSTVDHAVVRYGGYNSNGNIKNNRGTLTVTNSEIASASFGLKQYDGSTDISQSYLHNDSTYGIYNYMSSTSVTAIDNYWDDSSGPYNASTNPTGTGNSVSNYVSYNPWLTSWP